MGCCGVLVALNPADTALQLEAMSDEEVIAGAMAVSGLNLGLLRWLLGFYGVLMALNPADTALRWH